MLETLLIYDNNGKVYFNAIGESDSLPTPVGLPYLVFTMPNGKRLIDAQTQVDLSGETPQPILEDIPPNEIEALRSDLDNAILELSMMIAMGGM